jgi:hypothetical protein
LGKRGPFDLSGGVRVVSYGEWLMVLKAGIELPDEPPTAGEERAFTRDEFGAHVEASLKQGLLRYAPFWVSFNPEQKHRNVLVSSGRDPLWPKLSGQRAVPVIHALKLMTRWKDPQQVLWLRPLWP